MGDLAQSDVCVQVREVLDAEVLLKGEGFMFPKEAIRAEVDRYIAAHHVQPTGPNPQGYDGTAWEVFSSLYCVGAYPPHTGAATQCFFFWEI